MLNDSATHAPQKAVLNTPKLDPDQIPWHKLGVGLSLFPKFQIEKKKKISSTGLHTLGVLKYFLEH